MKLSITPLSFTNTSEMDGKRIKKTDFDIETVKQ